MLLSFFLQNRVGHAPHPLLRATRNTNHPTVYPRVLVSPTKATATVSTWEATPITDALAQQTTVTSPPFAPREEIQSNTWVAVLVDSPMKSERCTRTQNTTKFLLFLRKKNKRRNIAQVVENGMLCEQTYRHTRETKQNRVVVVWIISLFVVVLLLVVLLHYY